MAEILSQIDNQNCFWGAIIPFQADRLRHTRELIEAATQMAVFAEMRFKHELACWRPTDYSPFIQPMVTTPGHGSFPSGHCTQSYVVCEVLKALLKTKGKPDVSSQKFNGQLDRVAARIATNRVVAGVHFPVDNVAGRLVGTVLGEYFVYQCSGHKGPVPRWHTGIFDGMQYLPEGSDFDPVRQPLVETQPEWPVPPFYKFKEAPIGQTLPPSVLSELWDKAFAECALLSLPLT